MEQQTVRGTGVVAGFAYAPAAWTRPAPGPPSNPAPITEEDRPAEVERFKRAAQTVVTRFEDRASNATGAASDHILELKEPARQHRRHGDGEALLVLANFYGEPTSFELPEGFDGYATRDVLISNEADAPTIADGSAQLRPFEAVALHLK